MQRLSILQGRHGRRALSTLSHPAGVCARRGVAAMEFALISPLAIIMIWGVFDAGRALVAWQETFLAAEAVAQAAEKLSVTGTNNSVTGAPILALTSQAMQDAMTSVYAEMSFLGLGDYSGAFTGNFSVTLSGVTYNPPCIASALGPASCTLPQIPQVIWSAYLNQGGRQLLAPPAVPVLQVQRPCGTPKYITGAFPNTVNQLQTLTDVNKSGVGGTSVVLIPQVVADVSYVFTPTFPLLGRSYTFWASASFPAPLGGDDQPILFDLTHSTSYLATVVNCVIGPAYGGSI